MIKRDFRTLWNLYTESEKTAREVITLKDIAKKTGKTLGELRRLFKRS
ncbi:MAG: hypothetical protein GSR74_03405 [Desulfurococcales archaeon]|nr:hypothetical protein [Desulfurococcales archaeon]